MYDGRRLFQVRIEYKDNKILRIYNKYIFPDYYHLDFIDPNNDTTKINQ